MIRLLDSAWLSKGPNSWMWQNSGMNCN